MIECHAQSVGGTESDLWGARKWGRMEHGKSKCVGMLRWGKCWEGYASNSVMEAVYAVIGLRCTRMYMGSFWQDLEKHTLLSQKQNCIYWALGIRENDVVPFCWDNKYHGLQIFLSHLTKFFHPIPIPKCKTGDVGDVLSISIYERREKRK